MIEKRVNLRIEHVHHSRSRDDFLRRVKSNVEIKAKARADGTVLQVKRQPALPRVAVTVSIKDNRPETVTPLPYETTI